MVVVYTVITCLCKAQSLELLFCVAWAANGALEPDDARPGALRQS